MNRNTAVVWVVAAALAFAFFIWPTPYRYEKVTRPWGRTGKSIQEVYRITRLTGSAKRIVSYADEYRAELAAADGTRPPASPAQKSSICLDLVVGGLLLAFFVAICFLPSHLVNRRKSQD